MEVSSPTGPFLKNKYGLGSQSSPFATCCHMDCFCQTPFSYSPGSPSFPTPPSPSPLSTLCLLQNPFPLPILPSLVPVLPPPSAPVSPFHPPRFPSLPEPSPPSLAPPLSPPAPLSPVWLCSWVGRSGTGRSGFCLVRSGWPRVNFALSFPFVLRGH